MRTLAVLLFGIVVAVAGSVLYGATESLLGVDKPFLSFVLGYALAMLVAWGIGKVVAVIVLGRRVTWSSVVLFATVIVVTMVAISPMVDIPTNALSDVASNAIATATRNELTAVFPVIHIRVVWAGLLSFATYVLALFI